MLLLYPELKPYKRHQFSASELHELYLDESGNPDGIPVLYVHGGPGAACGADSRRYFDPEVYRIITFDQRGCGRSTPHGELRANNTDCLIEDVAALRGFLNIDQWVLFGGSWGSTLSLLYAQRFPEHVKGLILRGVFLGRQQDLDWLYVSGAGRVFPDSFEEFLEAIPPEERDEPISAYYRRLTGLDELAQMSAAKAWSVWEAHCSTLRPSSEIMERFSKSHNALAMARIETHFMVNRLFIRENQILDDMSRIDSIPGKVVHGRYDMVCPLDNATALHSRWPVAELYIIREAGHSATEPGITDALVRAAQDMATELDENF
ncbi:MAG: prolyl aminopeptidase [Pseudohongiellaceae bacterium]